MPATTPGEPEVFTVPTAVLLLLQVPPVGEGVRDVVEPTQIDDDPDNVGVAFTVIVLVTEHVPMLYVTIEVPAATPSSDPLDEPMVATAVLPLAHEPPETEFVSVIDCATQTEAGPPIAAGVLLTVTTCVTVLPPAVYDTVAVPDEIPPTTPDVALTVATPTALLAHVPPDTLLLSVIVFPEHTWKGEPVIAGSSVATALPIFHLSPASAPPAVFSALITPRIVTLPVPDDGAVHGTVTTYVVPDPPDPVVAAIALLCSTTLIPAAVTVCVPVTADKFPAVALLLFTVDI